MTIEEYIKSKPSFNFMPFMTVYTTITLLINDGIISSHLFEKVGASRVGICKPEPKEKECRRLHRESDFISNR